MYNFTFSLTSVLNCGQGHPSGAFLFQERDTLAIVQETVWAPRPVWSGAGNLAFTAIRSPDHYPPCLHLGYLWKFNLLASEFYI
jgi:hypothetical protein